MVAIFKTIMLRLRLAWCALLGRQAIAYLALVEGRPVASGIAIKGCLIVPKAGYIQGCVVSADPSDGHGIVAGANCVIVACVVYGMGGYGYAALEPEKESVISK